MTLRRVHLDTIKLFEVLKLYSWYKKVDTHTYKMITRSNHNPKQSEHVPLNYLAAINFAIEDNIWQTIPLNLLCSALKTSVEIEIITVNIVSEVKCSIGAARGNLPLFTLVITNQHCHWYT